MSQYSKSPHGHEFEELTSLMQKSIRRGEEELAIYAATQLDLAGYDGYVLRRLQVICSEDIGIAWPEGPAVIAALKDSHEAHRKHNKTTGSTSASERLFLIHAVLLLCRAAKSRMVDHIAWWAYKLDDDDRIEIPDWAQDKHTPKGRAMKRGVDHFLDEATRLEPPSQIDDPVGWEKRAREMADRPFNRAKYLPTTGDQPELMPGT